jgi:hypothetical protein
MKILIEPFPFMELPPLTHGVITPTFIEIQLVTVDIKFGAHDAFLE